MQSFENFSAEEKHKLSPYVTNTDQSIFVLHNLPEVLKGALFSRYSRSKLGLRSLLLKEFMGSKDSGFQSIAVPSADSSLLSIQKAQDFYDRVLDGYGDDSIAELGGAHLALENLSMIATKHIEDARIGGSPLEKSTRYIYFDEKSNGDYLFYKDPKILSSPHKDSYLSTCRNLFDTYTHCVPLLSKYVEKILPRETGITERAYQASLRARVCDSLRGLLPASTLTNMGVFGNGRFFESLIQKLRVSPLSETQEIAEIAFQELSKVIPSFVRRGQKGHRHFEAWKQFQDAQKRHLTTFVASLKNTKPQDLSSVVLTDHTPDAECKVAAALLFEQTHLPLSQLLELTRGFSNEALQALFKGIHEPRGNRRHKSPRALEHAEYTFDLLGDFGIYRDLHRHRQLTQERQLLSTRFGFDTPADIQDSGLEKIWKEAMEKAAHTYESIVQDFPVEAQYVVPMAHNIRWYFKVNLRSLVWLCELRSTPQGHVNYRKMAQDMAKAVMQTHPGFAPFFKFVDFNSYDLGRLDAEIRQEKKL
jgi:thymidylate synthase ThyX